MNWDEITHVQTPPLETEDKEPARQQAYLIVLAGSMMGEMFKVGPDRTVIGRGQKAELRILDEGISREHCEIIIRDGKPILRDLESTNGTFCKGIRITEHELTDGDKILVGSNTVLKFTYHDQLDQEFQRQMYESALRDDLTKAFNKKYFVDRIESEFAYSVRHHVPLTLVSFDLDHFKNVNDTLGHPAGDHVLAEVGGVVLDSIRVEDVFARVGGEEFAVICRGTDAKQGEIVAERLRSAVAGKKLRFENKDISVTISIGLATIPGHSIRDASEFIAAADVALYDAKHAGRNRVAIYPKKK